MTVLLTANSCSVLQPLHLELYQQLLLPSSTLGSAQAWFLLQAHLDVFGQSFASPPGCHITCMYCGSSVFSSRSD